MMKFKNFKILEFILALEIRNLEIYEIGYC